MNSLQTRSVECTSRDLTDIPLDGIESDSDYLPDTMLFHVFVIMMTMSIIAFVVNCKALDPENTEAGTSRLSHINSSFRVLSMYGRCDMRSTVVFLARSRKEADILVVNVTMCYSSVYFNKNNVSL